jgi:citrate/tricarballylate utilization protein
MAAVDPGTSAEAAEARRQLAICNICNYCNGLCAVFSAAERRRRLTDGDLDQLANLCHHCRSCLYDCQYAPPHAFAVNLPRALARQRWQSFARYAWPRALARSFDGSGRWTAGLAAAVVLAFTLAVVLAVPAQTLLAVHTGPGAFYRVVPFGVMTGGAALSLGFALLAIGIGVARFWRATAPATAGAPPRSTGIGTALGRAALDLLTLKNQSGGGPGCADLDHRPSRLRRRFHHAVFYGFLLCLASTMVAAGQHHLLGQQAPYPLLSAPVLLGTAGGIGMVAGCIGLLWLHRREDPSPTDPGTRGADVALIWLLLAVAATGLALLALRGTGAMGLLLAVHLGTVLALFVLLPYSKMVHGAYRAAALLRDALQ